MRSPDAECVEDDITAYLRHMDRSVRRLRQTAYRGALATLLLFGALLIQILAGR